MEPVLTPDEMRAADEATIDAGTPGAVLMDRAASACAAAALRMLGGGYGRRVAVVCGKGNNGGDGIAAARHLASAGASATVLLVADPAGDAATHLEPARRAGVRLAGWSASTLARGGWDLVVDAVLGTGFRGAPNGAVAEAIAAIPPSGVLAIDIPSGVSGADGSAPGPAVQANVTVAIQALKAGHVVAPGAFLCGRIDVADVGIALPRACVNVAEAADVARVLPVPAPDTNKYRVGVLAVLAGSSGMTGAGILTAAGAMRAGAGLVVLGVPRPSLAVFEEAVVEAVKVPLPDDEGRLGAKAVDEFSDRLAKASAVAVGPGIGRGPGAVALVRRVLKVPLPVVVDADGLNALAEVLREDPAALRTRSAPTVLTPHTGEFERLAGAPPGQDRIADTRAAAERWGAVVHLKGRRAVTAAPDGRAWVNVTGNPGMASGGTGDVLTGVVGALLSQGMDAADATWAAAFVHGLAGDVAAARLGARPLTARDLAEALPNALRRTAVAPSRDGVLRSVIPDPEVA